MAENSKIEWCDHTFNPWIGCSKVHAGCQHCYAEADFDKRRGVAQWGPRGTRVVTSEANWKKPLTWNRKAEREGRRYRVFCASLADVFEDWQGPMCSSDGKHLVHVPGGWHGETDEQLEGASRVTMQDVRTSLFKLIDVTPNLDWILLTKRPENILRMWPSADVFDDESEHKAYWPNVLMLTSVSDQESADKQIPELLRCRDLSPVLGISAEPLLGEIRLRQYLRGSNSYEQWATGGGPNECQHGIAAGIRCRECMGLDWVIVGGESGPLARPMYPDWVKSIRDQCTAAGVPLFVKQMGGKRKPFPEIPDDILIRQFPNTTTGE